MEILLIVLGIAAVVGIYLWITYNALVALKIRVDEAWSDITVQLKRRADLIPNLIETVRGYASHEREVFENVTKARLTDTEDKIMASRRFFNGGVRELNTKIVQFPNNVFAGGLGFTEREFFEVEDAASIQEPPTVNF